MFCISRWLKRLAAGQLAHRQPVRKQPSARPWLESLEERLAPAVDIVNFVDQNPLPSAMQHLLGTATPRQFGSDVVVHFGDFLNALGSVYVDSPGRAVRDFSASFNYDGWFGNFEYFMPGVPFVSTTGVAFGYGTINNTAFFPTSPSFVNGVPVSTLVDGVWLTFVSHTWTNNGWVELWQGNGTQLNKVASIPVSASQLWNDNTGRPNFIAGSMTVSSTGLVTISHRTIGTRTVQLPSWNPQPTWKFGFSGTSGYSWDYRMLRDLRIIDNNVAPTISVSPGGSFTDAVPRTLSWTTSDGNGDPLTVRANIIRSSDNVIVATSTLANGSLAVPRDPGKYKLVVTADDGSAPKVTATSAEVSIDDDDQAAPTIQLQGPAAGDSSVAEDQTFTWTIQDASPLLATVTIIKEGVATPIFSQQYTSNVTSSFDFNSHGVGTYTINIQAEDRDDDRTGDRSTATPVTRIVNVINKTPVATIQTPGALDEGTSATFSATATDAESEALTYIWNFGDGAFKQGAQVAHAYADDGVYQGKLTVVDTFGNAVVKPFSVTVLNVAPGLVISGPTVATEGAAYILQIEVEDPGNDHAEVFIDWKDGSPTTRLDASGVVSHVYAAGGVERLIEFRVQDEDGQRSFSRAVTINNAPPVISGLPALLTSQAGVPTTIRVQVTDGADDELTYFWDFGDGATQTGAARAQVTHTYAADGSYRLSLRVADSDGTSTTVTADVFIGAAVSLARTEQTVNENGTVTITAHLAEGTPLGHQVIVPLTWSGNAGLADYARSASQIVIPQGALTGSITLHITSDTLDEADEQIVVGMETPIGASIGSVATQRITLLDDDAQPTVFFVSPSRIIAESIGVLPLTASLTAISGRDVIVPIALSGTAVAGIDYSAPALQIVIPAGALTGTLNLAINDDITMESAETLIVSMGASEQATLSNESEQPTSASFVIAQSDARTVSLESAYRLTAEGIPSMLLSARLSSYSDERISVPFRVMGTATGGGADYRVLESTFEFLPGSEFATVTVAITDDMLVEGTEHFVAILEPTANVLLGTSRTVVTEILDNDQVRVSFEPGLETAFEGALLPIKVKLSNPSVQNTIVPLVFSGTAQLKQDYTTTATSLTIPAGATEATFTVSLVNNFLNEPTETLFLALGDIVGGIAGDLTHRSIVIQDNDPIVTLEAVGPTVIAENNGSTTMRVRFSAPSNRNIAVSILHTGTATKVEYATQATILMPAGTVEKDFVIQSRNDNADEPTETIIATLVKPAGTELGTATSVTVSILDDDAPLPQISWNTTSVMVNENQGLVVLTVSLSQSVGQDTKINLDFNPSVLGLVGLDTAKSGVDYTASQIITIPAGATSAELRIPIVNDEEFETDEFFTVAFDGRNPAVMLPKDSFRHEVRVSILNDDLTAFERELQRLRQLYVDQAFVPNVEAEEPKEDGFSTTDGVLATINYLAKALPPGPWKVAHLLTWTLIWLRDEYPLGEGINGSAAWRDMKSDPAGFGRRWGQRMVWELFKSYGGPLGTAAAAVEFYQKYEETIKEKARQVEDAARELGGEISRAYKRAFAGFGDGAVIFFDVDFNGVRSTNEPLGYTGADGATLIAGLAAADANGNGLIDFDEGQWVMEGGVDTSVNQGFRFPLIAPDPYRMITPSSTIVAKLLNLGAFERTGEGIRDAERRYFAALGVQDRPLALYDFLREAADGNNDAASLFGRETQLYSTIILAASLFERNAVGLPFAFLADVVIEDIATKIATPGSALNLTHRTVIANLLEGVAIRTGITVSPATLDAVSDLIARVNGMGDAIPVEGSRAYLDAVVRVQSMAQGTLANAVARLGGGEISLAEFQASTIDLDPLLAETVAFNVLPVYVGVTNAWTTEGNDGTTTLTFEVTPFTDFALPITVNYHTVAGTATEGHDFLGATGSLSWAPGDTTPRLITVTVLSDTVLEADETLSLMLSELTNASFFASLGTGTIHNDEWLRHETSADAVNEVVLSIEGDSVVLEQDGVRLVHGDYARGLHLDLVGHGGDTLTVFNRSTGVIQSIDLTGQRTFTIGAHTIEVAGFTAVSDELSTTIVGLPARIVAGTAVPLTAPIPAGLDAENLTYAWRVFAGAGVVQSGAAADFTLLPQEGMTRIEVTLTDGARSSTVLQDIHVRPANSAPIASDDQASTDEDESIAIDVFANDTDEDGNLDTAAPRASARLIAGPVHGVAVFDSASGRFVYTPAPDYFGPDSFVYEISDREGVPAQAAVSITVRAVNDAPVAQAQSLRTAEDTPATLQLGATDVDSATLRYTIVTGPAHGRITAFDPDTGTVLYMPHADYHGSDRITFLVSDGAADSKVATIDLGMDAVNDAPSLTVLRGTASDELHRVVTLEGAFLDPDADDTQTVSIDWGDGSETTTVPATSAGNVFQTSHTYAAVGAYAISVTVRDQDDTGDTRSVHVTARHIAPAITSIGVSASAIHEGQSVAVQGTLSSTTFGAGLVHGTAVWSDGAATPLTIDAAGIFTTTRFFADDVPTGTASDVFTVAVTVHNDGGSASASTGVTVHNAAPTLLGLASSTDAIMQALPVQVAAAFADVGALDTHTAIIHWGDGTSSPASLQAASRTLAGSHVYRAGGVYTITVVLQDDDGGIVSASSQAVVAGTRLQDGVLEVYGTEGRDTIQVHRHGQRVVVHTRLGTAPPPGAGDDSCHEDRDYPFYRRHEFSAADVRSIAIDARGGDDRVHVGPKLVSASIDGGAGNDRIHTSDGGHRIVDRLGDNEIHAGGGDNQIIVGDGDNNIRTGAGDDQVTVGHGNNNIDTGSGDDSIITGNGDNVIDAGAGNDLVLAGAGNDVIDGGSGNDILVGGAGRDTITGDQGRDLLIGGLGADTLSGSQDDDLLIAGWTQFDANAAALGVVLREWERNLPSQVRANHLTGATAGGVNQPLGVLLRSAGPGQTVFDDDAIDRLTGSQGDDWLLGDAKDLLKN